MTSPGLLKIKIFWKKAYDVIISAHDVTNTILSWDSNYIVNVIMWPKFGNSKISVREVIITSILRIWPEKLLFWWVVLVQVQQLGTGTRYGLEISGQCGKRVKTKSQKVLGANLYVCRSNREKTGRGGEGLAFAILNRIKIIFVHLSNKLT